MSKFENIAIHVGQIKWLKKLLMPFWKFFVVEPREKKKRKAIFANGISFLEKFDSVLKINNVPYSLAFGTLLGAVREKGFIKHDLDIDVALWSDTNPQFVCNILNEAGFKKISEIVVESGNFAREETYTYLDISIDLFYFYPSEYEGLFYTCTFVPFKDCLTWEESINKHAGVMPLQLFLPMDKEVEYVPFETIKLPITKSAMDFVETRYGKNWRIPDPSFVYPMPGFSKYSYREDKVGILKSCV